MNQVVMATVVRRRQRRPPPISAEQYLDFDDEQTSSGDDTSDDDEARARPDRTIPVKQPAARVRVNITFGEAILTDADYDDLTDDEHEFFQHPPLVRRPFALVPVSIVSAPVPIPNLPNEHPMLTRSKKRKQTA